MTSAEQYAKWCVMLIEGDDHMINDIYDALYEDGFIDDDQEWIADEDDEDEEY